MFGVEFANTSLLAELGELTVEGAFSPTAGSAACYLGVKLVYGEVGIGVGGEKGQELFSPLGLICVSHATRLAFLTKYILNVHILCVYGETGYSIAHFRGIVNRFENRSQCGRGTLGETSCKKFSPDPFQETQKQI